MAGCHCHIPFITTSIVAAASLLVIGATFNLLEFRGNYSATSINMKLVHWPLMGGLLHLVE